MHMHSRKMSSWNRIWWHQLSLPWKGGMAISCMTCTVSVLHCADFECTPKHAYWVCTELLLWQIYSITKQDRMSFHEWTRKLFMLHISNMNADNLFLSHISKDEIQRNQRAFHKHFLSVIKCHKFPDKMGWYIWLRTNKNVICWCSQS